jgi:hypothetical protein
MRRSSILRNVLLQARGWSVIRIRNAGSRPWAWRGLLRRTGRRRAVRMGRRLDPSEWRSRSWAAGFGIASHVSSGAGMPCHGRRSGAAQRFPFVRVLRLGIADFTQPGRTTAPAVGGSRDSRRRGPVSTRSRLLHWTRAWESWSLRALRSIRMRMNVSRHSLRQIGSCLAGSQKLEPGFDVRVRRIEFCCPLICVERVRDLVVTRLVLQSD